MTQLISEQIRPSILIQPVCGESPGQYHEKGCTHLRIVKIEKRLETS